MKLKEAIFEVDQEMAMELIVKLLENSKFPFLKKIFTHISKVVFDENKVIFHILMFNYYLKIKSYPKNIAGRFVFEHNLPSRMLKSEDIPDFIKIDEKEIEVNIPENPLIKIMKIKEMKLEKGKFKLVLNVE